MPPPACARRPLLALALAVAACAPQAPGSGVADVPAPTTPVPAAPPVAPPAAPSDRADRADVPGLPARPLDLPTLALVPIGTFATPVATAVTPDGQVLVAERAGTVRRITPSGPGPVVLDLRARTTTDGERGLLDIAVAPWGDELFVSRTDPVGDTLVEAYPLVGSQVEDSPRTVYALPQPYPNHNGGSLVFLPDATLLLGLGDGGGAGDPLGAGQDLTTPLGALVRLDVRDGVRVPSDNPFVDRAGAAPEIVASGVRNPWRMSLDAARGELWVADVGQSAREEVNRIPLDVLPGANLGWALREGSVAFDGEEPAGHLAPVYDYPHGPGCSVTGGLVYRGAALPELVGGYVFADLCDGRLQLLTTDDGGRVDAVPLGVTGERIVGFGVDAAGELLVLELGGTVLRLVRG